MERLTQSDLLADNQVDPRASGWITDNLLHPFINGTGVTQLYNNFVGENEKIAPAYVPEAKTLSKDWALHSLASASGAVLTYALAGKVAGVGLGAVSSAAGFEGATAGVLKSATTAQIAGAGLYDFAKAPNAGETRLGNAAGTVAAFGLFSVGNEALGLSKTISQSTFLSGLGRVGVGMAGGLTSIEASHFVSRKLGVDSEVSWDDRYNAMVNGGFINVAMPAVQKGLSNIADAIANYKPFEVSVVDPTAKLIDDVRAEKLPQLEIQQGPRAVARSMNLPDGLEPKGPRDIAEPKVRPAKNVDSSSAEAGLPKIILLTQQLDPAARQAQIEKVAGELAGFIDQAQKSVDTAIYDFRVRDPKAESLIVGAYNRAAERGVDVKIAFFQPNVKPAGQGIAHTAEIGGDAAPAEQPVSHGASPELLAKLHPKIQIQHVTLPSDAAQIPDPFRAIVGDARQEGAGVDRVVDLQNGKPGDLSSDVGTHGILGGGKLMHNKYVVVDAGTPNAKIWTGSTNFTDDAFGSQDNNIIQIQSKPLASVYAKDFQQMWDKGAIAGTGRDLHTTINYGDGQVTVAFSPGDGEFIDAEYAKRVAAAKDSVHIASMVISSPEVLKALSDKIDEGVKVTGIYDGPQMAQVARAWGRGSSDASREKLELWNKVKQSLVEKHSHPYTPDGIHDFMHNKMLSIDGQVAATGSFNISKNATFNAENVLIFDSNVNIATSYSNYIDNLVHIYGSKGRVAVK